MKNCQKKSAKIVGVRNGGISDFHPPLSNKKDKLSVKSSKLDVKKIYKDSCAMCHTDDSMGAPVAGKKADWEAKKKNGGIKGIYKRGIKGLNVMPPKGGAGISDDEFKKVVDYMINLK